MLVELVGILFFLQFLQHHHRLQSHIDSLKNQNNYLFLSYTYVKMVSGRGRDCNLTNKTDSFGICSKLIAILILPTFHSLNFPLSTAINQALFQYYDATALNLLF